jgi:hypothetical protein
MGTTRPLIEDVTDAHAQDQAIPVAGSRRLEGSQRSALRAGFFNSKAKPKRGILKQSKAPEQGAEGSVECKSSAPWSVSPTLLHKSAPTQSERSAFSGSVRERRVGGSSHEV